MLTIHSLPQGESVYLLLSVSGVVQEIHTTLSTVILMTELK